MTEVAAMHFAEASPLGLDCGELDPVIGPVSNYPRFEFTMHEVKRAGEVIAGNLPWTEESAAQIREAFLVANNWRDAHAYPMRSVRYSMIALMRRDGVQGITAARLKRMQAIRRKLRRLSMNLNQLQDLGGCRAILPSVADVRTVAAAIQSGRHDLRKQDDYVTNPKPDGYRSHHLMLSYRGKGDATIHDGRRIEVQLRTRLQHSWATAVEAVGLFRGEDLKGGRGSPKWLRLFTLMSAEFAAAEGCPEPNGVPSHVGRISEIKSLNEELEAAATLDNLSHAVDWTETSFIYGSKPSHYLIIYENKTRRVRVVPKYFPENAVISYDNAEAIDNKADGETVNVVLVEVDKLDNLIEAYPNYFGDVQLFKNNLGRIVKGKDIAEYAVVRQETVPPKPRDLIDWAWLTRRYRQWK